MLVDNTDVLACRDYLHDALLLRGYGLAALTFLIFDGGHQVGEGYLKHT